jgi:radical SAM superfamily enzyme YgiQ (UPF0313 family)
MPGLDVAFLHVPRSAQGRHEIMVLPLGLPALCNLLADAGRRAAMLHVGIERELDARFSLRSWLQAHQPRMVLLPWHWHQQTRGVIELGERVRAWLPETRIFLGGLTASVFAEQALAALPFLDGVVRGDGELPLLGLATAVLDGTSDLASVPNLVWRAPAGESRDNGLSWSLDAATAGRLRHGDLGLLRHCAAYLARALYADFSEGARGSEGYRHAAYLNAGRGCAASCVACGGAAEGQARTSARHGILLYPLDKLVRDVREAVAQGATTLRMSFDPPAARDHVRQWFAAIRAEGFRLRLVYDCWHLPTPALLDELAASFVPGSVVVLSPECGNEPLRRRLRSHAFSNAELLGAIAQAEERGLEVHCFFSAGLPGETPADVAESASLIERIARTTRAAVSVCPMVLDPASPMFLHPERYGVRLLRRELGDFYDERGLPGGPGYETEHFDEQGILEACNRLLAAGGLPGLGGGKARPP